MEPDLFDAVLVVGAAARLTRLVTDDTIGRPARDALRTAGRRLAGADGLVWADELATCPWCAGFWVALAVVASWAAWGAHPAWQAVAGVLAVAWAVGWLGTATGDPED